jgi:hypothetical protein
MKIEISAEKLRTKKLFIGMPCYGGQMTGMTAKSLLDLQALMIQYGVDVRFSFLFNESLIQRARNYIVDEFLNRSDCTHMMFIDADIAFNPQDIVAMLALDKEIIGGPYPKKSIEWGQLHKAIQKNPALPIDEYQKLVGAMVFNPVGGTQRFSVTEPLEVSEVGTGFCMYRREVFEKFQEAYPEYMYKPDHVGQAHFGGDREICSFFNVFIDPESRRTLSEDYCNCHQMRKLGIKVWMCPWMQLSHVGTYIFTGNLPAVAQHLGEL